MSGILAKGMAAAAVLLIAGAASAATIKWEGDINANGYWISGENWNGGTVPAVNDIASFDNLLYLSRAQPRLHNAGGNKSVGELRVVAPKKDVELRIDSSVRLTMRDSSSTGIAIRMTSSDHNMRIWGAGEFKQDNLRGLGGGVNRPKRWDISGTGIGDLTIETSVFTLDNNLDLTMNIGSGRNIYLNTAAAVTSAKVTKALGGTLHLGASMGWTGDTIIGDGTLQLTANNALSASSALTLGATATMGTGGYDGDFSTLEVSGNADIDFEGIGTSALAFEDSSAITWAGNLEIVNFTLDSDSIRFGTNSAGLTQTQLDEITVNGVDGYLLDTDGYLTYPPTEEAQGWTGSSNTDWHVSANWASNSVPGEDGVALFGASSINNLPFITSEAILDQLRVENPGQDIEITVASNTFLRIDHSTAAGHRSINLGSAENDLIISGDGKFVQRAGLGTDPLWDVTGTNIGGDLIIDTASFDMGNLVDLTIDVGASRTVDFKARAENGSATVTKTGDGLLVLGGQNSWNGQTTIDAGTLRLGTNNALDTVSPLAFNDGALLETGGFIGDFGTLEINGTVMFDFESLGSSALTFDDSSGIAWGSSLVLSNFTIGGDSVRFGTDGNGLTAGQLAEISLNGETNLLLDSNGYLVTGSTAAREWEGDVDSDWHAVSNWVDALPPDEDGVAVFGAAFASNNAQPEITANATVDQIEITDPGKDVVITIASNYTLNVDHHTEGSHLALDLGAAISNLTISGEGGFVQRGGTALNPLWDVTSTNGGDLIVDTDSFVISNGVALGIDIGAGRTVDLQTGADVSSASVSKSGDGLLILGGQNGWTGMTTIDGGTLQLADDNALSSASTVRFNDGSRLEVEGHDGGFGALDVNGTVVFDFANFGTSALSFGDSTGLSWGSAALVISNFTVGSDSIRFGTDAGGLTSGQLGDITLNGDANVLLDYNGYLVTGTEGNSTWTGDVDADWYTGSNWTAAVPPGENGVAAFFSSFALSNAQPTVTTSAAVDKIRVGNPAQDVVITVASGQILSVDHATDADLYAIDLDSASDDLTITGSGTFKQRGGTALTPVWNVTDSGDLTLETDGFSIEDGAALRITISSTRTVDLKSGAGSSSASVEKTGAGLLILSGQNGWTGDTSITAGTLQLGTNNALSANSAVSFSGGSMKTGGFDGDFGTLELTGSITFDFESAGTSDLAFANSTNLAWSGDLAIVNFSNEVDSIRFGTSSNGLTSAQLDGITVNGETNYVLDVDGYLVSGASPLDPIEDLEIGAAGGDVVLSWTGTDGQSYDVESKTNLVVGSWQLYTNFIGDGGYISFTSTVGEAAEFYRVKSE